MTEGLATPEGLPSDELNRLYGRWSAGGAGILLSGNIQVDPDHLERPGNVIVAGLPNNEMQSALASWASVGTRNGNHFWAQISHAGRQTQTNVNKHPKAPSAVTLGLPGGQFGKPIPLTQEEIGTSFNDSLSAARHAKKLALPAFRFTLPTATCYPSF